MTNWDNLIAIVFISFIFAAGDEMEMSPFFPVVIFLINVVIQALVNVIGDLKIKNACKQVNQCTV